MFQKHFKNRNNIYLDCESVLANFFVLESFGLVNVNLKQLR